MGCLFPHAACSCAASSFFGSCKVVVVWVGIGFVVGVVRVSGGFGKDKVVRVGTFKCPTGVPRMSILKGILEACEVGLFCLDFRAKWPFPDFFHRKWPESGPKWEKVIPNTENRSTCTNLHVL